MASPAGFHVLGGTCSGLHGHYLPPISSIIPECTSGLYASSCVTSKYFGHWLTDGIPTCLLANEKEILYLWHRKGWSNADQYLQLIGIAASKHQYVYFNELSFVDDIGMTNNRRQRLQSINQAILATRSRLNPNRIVYMRRGQTGINRIILNEDELVSRLISEDFCTVDVDQPLEGILDICAGAKCTVSMEGSHCSHLVMSAAPGAKHFTLNPSDRFNNIFAEYMPAFSGKFATVVVKNKKMDNL
ncbi:glycosyltransferase 61 family protein [Roseibium sp.]|uniref:glycosyltransferase 61 family protein n=1 Tax=Roseibium sp. TaxID=1936156 RepID=UPI0039190CAA